MKGPRSRCASDRRRGAPQILRAGEDVEVFAVAASARILGGAERVAVADAGPVVDRHHDVALTRQPLIDGVRLVIELHVVVAGQHLPLRSAVHEDDRRTLLAGLEVRREKELVADVDAVGRLGVHDLRNDVGVDREFLRQLLDRACRSARRRHHRDELGLLGRRVQDAEILPDPMATGDVSMPSPEVSCFGSPPDVGTDQMCRCSMSLALVQ